MTLPPPRCPECDVPSGMEHLSFCSAEGTWVGQRRRSLSLRQTCHNSSHKKPHVCGDKAHVQGAERTRTAVARQWCKRSLTRPGDNNSRVNVARLTPDPKGTGR